MTKIFAHRGARSSHPENTLAAFQAALDLGADGIELDVHMTLDGELVVIHDETIDRTSDGQGQVGQMTLAQLREYSFGAWFGPQFAQEKIPTLGQVYDLLVAHHFKGSLNIEIKTDVIMYPGIVQKVLDLEQEKQASFHIIYSSFNPYTIQEVRSLSPQADLAFLFESTPFAAFDFQETKIDAWHPDLKLLDWALTHNPQAFPFRVWTVNEGEDLMKCFQLGVEGVFTDDPGLALQIRGAYEA